MLKAFRAALLLVAVIICFSTRVSGQQQPAKIEVAPPQVVNFQQLSEWELANPIPIIMRFVEQEEDVDKDFKIAPRPVPPNSRVFRVQTPAGMNAELKTEGLPASPKASISFNGIMANGTVTPPDIRGAVGPLSILETSNQQFGIYSKSGSLLHTLKISTFFSITGGSGYFDPQCVYDANYGRFVISMDGLTSTGLGGIFLAVSKTDDPTGNWYIYSFAGVRDTTDYLDYPLLGFNSNWVVITANNYYNGITPIGKIYVVDRESLYAGVLDSVSTFTDNSAYCLNPCKTYGKIETTEYLVEDYNGSSDGKGYVKIGNITGTPSLPVYTSGSILGVDQPWGETSINAAQEGSTELIDVDDTRIANAVYSKGSLWFTHTVFLPAAEPTYSGVDWWQINPVRLSVKQFCRMSDSIGPMFYYYPSIHVNAVGDMILGYCQSSGTSYPSAGYAYHGASDPSNTLRAGCIYKSGAASYYLAEANGRNRWGDYSGADIDPVDSSFWVFGQWANKGNKWGTAIARIPITSTLTEAPVSQDTDVAEYKTGNNTVDSSSSLASTTTLAPEGRVLNNMKLYPNPAESWLTAEFTCSVEGNLAVSVYDIAGQKVINSGYFGIKGLNTTAIETAKLSDGVYIVEIECNGDLIRQKLIIAR